MVEGIIVICVLGFIALGFRAFLIADTKEFKEFIKNRHNHKCENCLNFKPIDKRSL